MTRCYPSLIPNPHRLSLQTNLLRSGNREEEREHKHSFFHAFRSTGDMKDDNRRWISSSFSSSSVKSLQLLVVPLFLVFTGLFAVLGFSNFSWSSIDKYYSSLWSSPTLSSSSNFDLHSTMAVVDNQNIKEAAVSDDSILHFSSSPPLHVEAVQPQNGSVEKSFNTSKNGRNSTLPAVKARRKRKSIKLERIEAGLRRARAAITAAKNGNQTHDPDYIPVGPMYRNANAFHRSYLEMENEFKVFVYEEGEPPLFHNGPCKSIYSTEGNFINGIEVNNQFRTRDPERAHVFFLPFSVAMLVRFVYVRDSRDFGPIKHTVTDYIDVIGRKYPFWNRSLGADHFMVSCHDWGPEASFSVPNLGKNSIRVLCNANTSEGFNPLKDVSFPEINLQTGSLKGIIGGPSPSSRPVLAFFAGGLHGPIRPSLINHWENKDDDIKVHQYLPKEISYYEMMRKSRFCICPSGYEVASPRIVEAIYTGCVPVLISDHYVPPFSDVLNWKSFSVEVTVTEIPNLKQILTSISSRQYIRMQRRVEKVRRHFEVNSPPKRFDVFHMILHSVWLRRLNLRVDEHD